MYAPAKGRVETDHFCLELALKDGLDLGMREWGKKYQREGTA